MILHWFCVRELGGRMTEKVEVEYVGMSVLTRRYGKNSKTIEAWMVNPKVGFPSPYIFGRNRSWRLSEIETWECTRKVEQERAA